MTITINSKFLNTNGTLKIDAALEAGRDARSEGLRLLFQTCRNHLTDLINLHVRTGRLMISKL